MSDLTALYQDVILDHNRRPRNFGPLEGANREQRGLNPNCGDEVTVWLRVEDDRIDDVRFVGKGCAISRASASLMTAAVKGKTRAEAEALYARFHDLVTRSPTAAVPPDTEKELGSLRVLSGVARFPARVKCATLAWHALQRALEGPDTDVVTSEAPTDGSDAS
jgi:nitrogen fixation protein NifU and related proteins